MLLFNLDLLMENPGLFLRLMLAIAVALVVAITVHEGSHALVATWQGDNTARHNRRLSLNPLHHMDPAGTLMLFLVGFGWGRPVPVNPVWLRSGPRVGTALVALAGPVSNLALAGAAGLLVRSGVVAWHSPQAYEAFSQTSPAWVIADLVGVIIFYNILLAVFNLLPIAPLDGFKVALGVLPREMARAFARLEPYGPGILMVVLLLSYMRITDFGLWDVLGPVMRTISLVVIGRPL